MKLKVTTPSVTVHVLCRGMPYVAHGMHILIHVVGYVEVWRFVGKPEEFWPLYYNLFSLGIETICLLKCDVALSTV